MDFYHSVPINLYMNLFHQLFIYWYFQLWMSAVMHVWDHYS